MGLPGLSVEHYEIEYTYRQKKDEELLKFLVLFFFLTSTAAADTNVIALVMSYEACFCSPF